jgi:hypothetical protein
MNCIATALGAAGLACAALACAQDRANMDPSRIVGNRELPKVLYIVPWKKPLAGDPAGRPPASVLDEALSPLDREVFRREVDYGNQVRAQGAPAAAPPAAAPTK